MQWNSVAFRKPDSLPLSGRFLPVAFQDLFPVIRFSVKYIRPLFYREEFVCKAILVESKHKLVVEFELRLIEDGTLCARARSEQAACKLPEMELMLRIPAELRELLGQS